MVRNIVKGLPEVSSVCASPGLPKKFGCAKLYLYCCQPDSEVPAWPSKRYHLVHLLLACQGCVDAVGRYGDISKLLFKFHVTASLLLILRRSKFVLLLGLIG